MNRGLPEMMLQYCLNSSGVVSSGAELTVFERQRACMKWQQGLDFRNGYSVPSQMENGSVGNQFQVQACGDSGLAPSGFPLVKPETGLEGAWTGFGNSYGMPSADNFVSCGYAEDDISYQMTKAASCPVSASGETGERKNAILTERTSFGEARESSKKRKAEKATSFKAVADDDGAKKMKEWAEDGESKITQQNRSGTNGKDKVKGEASADAASKVSEVQKTDYIHVRARRGQATDSHSLAERVRREKISERMKYLQELVPGCHKITGKAGMLDEIINYVKSLQRQVEFLSMKLATVNPQLNVSIESLFGKEVFHPCTSNFPTFEALSEMVNPAYIQFNHSEEIVSPGNYQPDMSQLADAYGGSTSFYQTPSTWNAELQNLIAMEFQGRSSTYASQAFTGSVEASNLKMEN